MFYTSAPDVLQHQALTEFDVFEIVRRNKNLSFYFVGTILVCLLVRKGPKFQEENRESPHQVQEKHISELYAPIEHGHLKTKKIAGNSRQNIVFCNTITSSGFN